MCVSVPKTSNTSTNTTKFAKATNAGEKATEATGSINHENNIGAYISTKDISQIKSQGNSSTEQVYFVDESAHTTHDTQKEKVEKLPEGFVSGAIEVGIGAVAIGVATGLGATVGTAVVIGVGTTLAVVGVAKAAVCLGNLLESLSNF